VPEGELFHVGTMADTGNTEAPRGGFHQLLVRITAAPSEPMVQVGNRQTPRILSAKVMENVQQNHRIDSAGNSHEHGLSSFQKAVFLDGVFDSI
jgi:hypothetical protein